MKCPFCHSERSEEFNKLNMLQMRMYSYEFEILRLTPQNDIFRQAQRQEESNSQSWKEQTAWNSV